MADKKYIGAATAINKGETYKTSLFTAGFELIADEPAEYGGTATGPSPADYLCMALSSCKAITMRMYARRKGWPVEEINVITRFVKGEPSVGTAPAFHCDVALTGQLTEAQRKRMLEIASVCPIERLLEKGCTVITKEQ